MGELVVVKLLVEKGADVNHRGMRLSVMEAAERFGHNPKLVKFLIKHGAVPKQAKFINVLTWLFFAVPAVYICICNFLFAFNLWIRKNGRHLTFFLLALLSTAALVFLTGTAFSFNKTIRLDVKTWLDFRNYLISGLYTGIVALLPVAFYVNLLCSDSLYFWKGRSKWLFILLYPLTLITAFFMSAASFQFVYEGLQDQFFKGV
jgi:hypothetical protein